MPMGTVPMAIACILSEVSDALEGGAGELRFLARQVTPRADRHAGGIDVRGETCMTEKTVRKPAFVVTKQEQGSTETATVQLAVPIPRLISRWFRHYALDQGLSMAELIRRILRDFMAVHRGPAE
jgi:hypothetical protein